MFIFLYGPDTYRSKEKLNQLKEKFKKQVDRSGLGVTVFEGKDLLVEQLHQAIYTAAFLMAKKLVIIKNILAEGKKKEVWEEIINSLEKIKTKDEIVLIFMEGEIPPLKGEKKKLFDLLKKEKYVQEFPFLSPESLNQWIKREVEKRGGVIDYQTIKRLALFVGDNLWQLSNEIDKLIALKLSAVPGKNKIIVSDIDLLVKAKVDDNIFHLIDALAERNEKKALNLINSQLASGTSWGYLLTMIIGYFRNLLLIREKIDLKESLNSYSLAKKLKIHPFVVQKGLVQAKKYFFKDLKVIYQKLLAMDLKLKSEKNNPETVFNLFVAELCEK